LRFDLAFYLTDQWMIAAAVGAVLVAACEVGYRFGFRKQAAPDQFRSLISGVSAAMLGLLGLLLGFTLSMAISRWDERRDVIVSEANAIGTLWLRAGLLEEPLRGELRVTLSDYTDARIRLAGSRDDLAALRAAREESEALHGAIWSAVERADQPGTSPAMLSALIASANELIDLHEMRMASLENFLPPAFILMLLAVAAVALAFLGWSFGAASYGGRLALLLLALLVTTVLILIMDVNRPQRGIVTVGAESLLRVQTSIAAPMP